ncbi:signal peptide peptidase SppA [Salidesulfovibrio brasiliensis]|uniref:signal peptide peptidase SppA n=1 Tax=Salidesulfovibrio brasiliensis TaxID=221711 RepID=UPI0006D2962A|nr:signal peptide peptidase SppA [Salidesulfovibrio brasiliensis]
MVRPVLLWVLIVLVAGCAPKVSLFGDNEQPLKEVVLEEGADAKVAVMSLDGFISASARRGMLSRRPSVVDELVMRLRAAEKDPLVRAVVVKINSPGGTVTASDIVYHELTRFRERTGKKVVACLMDTAASGGYYAALAADSIVAHPTTVTGSVGVIFVMPKVHGLMDKVGVEVDVTKSGTDKDMGSPFRPATERERAMFQTIIDGMAERFTGLVRERRSPGDEAMTTIASARIFTAQQAKALGMVDRIAHLEGAFEEAAAQAGIEGEPTIIAYRRTVYPDDTPYNSLSAASPAGNLFGADVSTLLPPPPGFHYLWTATGRE